PHGLHGVSDVVGANQVRTREHGGGGGGQRAGGAGGGMGLAPRVSDEGLWARPPADGPAEGTEAIQAREHRAVPVVPGDIAPPEETDTWIHHDALGVYAGPFGDVEGLLEHLPNRLDGRPCGCRSRLGGHDEEAGPALGGEP